MGDNLSIVVSTSEMTNNNQSMHISPNLMHINTPTNQIVIREMQNFENTLVQNPVSIPKEKVWITNMFKAYSINVITILAFLLGMSFGLIITGGIIISESSKIIVYVIGVSSAVVDILIIAYIGKLHKKRNRIIPS